MTDLHTRRMTKTSRSVEDLAERAYPWPRMLETEGSIVKEPNDMGVHICIFESDIDYVHLDLPPDWMEKVWDHELRTSRHFILYAEPVLLNDEGLIYAALWVEKRKRENGFIIKHHDGSGLTFRPFPLESLGITIKSNGTSFEFTGLDTDALWRAFDVATQRSTGWWKKLKAPRRATRLEAFG